MRDDHEALLTELLLLADTVLDRVEGVVQQFAESTRDTPAAAPGTTASAGEPDGATTPAASNGCTWCPLCAGAALLRGENHELVSRLAERIATLIAVLRELLARYLPKPPDDGGAAAAPEPSPGPPPRGRSFTPIEVTVRT
ncbi:hypothetical protein [Rhodococcus sp. Z13]|uniref:hypothetical protein n=1 Tax=Rhodococcus sacchari TaxID=2962047 RepID=UPI00298F3F80|nr:hypothetical protein [Rhodococcus sp. Z13]